jgi:hypothetical protein
MRALLKTRAGERTRVIQSIVDKAFASLAISCPDLAVIVLATMGNFSADDGTHSFLRTKQIDLRGETTFIGMPIEHHMIKHYEPCSEILEPERFGFCRRISEDMPHVNP